MPKRKYRIVRYYAVFCSACGEDITEGPVFTREEAKDHQATHEAWHARSDSEGSANDE